MKRFLSYVMVCLVALSLSVSYAHASPSKENNGVASADKNSGATVSQIKDNDSGDVKTSVALNNQLSGNSSSDALAETMEDLGVKVVYSNDTSKTFNLSGLSVLDQVATIDLSNTKVDSTTGKKVVTLSPAAQSTSYVGNDTVSIMFFNTETNDWEVITGDDITVNDDGTITVNFPAGVDSSTQFAIIYDADQNLDISVEGSDYDDDKQTTPIDSEQTTPTIVVDDPSNSEESTSTTTPTLVGDDSSNGEESTSTTTTKKSTKSKTGDDTPVVIYAGAGLVALVVVGALVYRGKKHN
jgi:hypothetical protein